MTSFLCTLMRENILKRALFGELASLHRGFIYNTVHAPRQAESLAFLRWLWGCLVDSLTSASSRREQGSSLDGRQV